MTRSEAMIHARIACDEADYYASEARFITVKEWEDWWGITFDEYYQLGDWK